MQAADSQRIVNMSQEKQIRAKVQQNMNSISQPNPSPQKHRSHSLLFKPQLRPQNPKIGRPAKTNQEQEFKKCYLQNKQKFQLECELLVHIHQSYFDEIIDNPINARISRQYMDRLFINNKCQHIYRTLLKLNEKYFKNSTLYPEEKLKYTSLIDVAYMFKTIKQQHGENLSCTKLLLVVFFHLYNEKLVNQKFFQYFISNFQNFRQAIIFGPGGVDGKKLNKLDKLIVCLTLTLAQLEQITIQEDIEYYEEQQLQASSGQHQKIQQLDEKQQQQKKQAPKRHFNRQQDQQSEQYRPFKRRHIQLQMNKSN